MENSTTTNQRRTTKVINNGHPVYVSTGAVRGHSGGTATLHVCNGCQGEVVWATSARTGRRYLCNVRTAANDGRYFMGNDLHSCNEVITYRQTADDVMNEARREDARQVLGKVEAWNQLVEMGHMTPEKAAEFIAAEAENIAHAQAVLAQ
jgi:hypothetical protein